MAKLADADYDTLFNHYGRSLTPEQQAVLAKSDPDLWKAAHTFVENSDVVDKIANRLGLERTTTPGEESGRF